MPKIIPIHWRRLEKVFISVGFRFARQEGSHRSYTKPGVARPIVIPTYDEVPVSIIRNNLKTAGITREEYFILLPEFCTESPAKGYGITKTLPLWAMPGTHAYPTFNQKGYAEKERTSQTPVNCGFIPPPEDPEK